jgi:hypothetical protein
LNDVHIGTLFASRRLMERECSRLKAQENRQQTRIVIHIANRGTP